MIDAIIIIIVVVLLALALKGSLKHFKGESPCCGGSHESYDIEEKKLQSPIIGKKTLEIEGMHCQNCVHHVMKAINSIEGASAKVDLDTHLAVVSYDRELNEQELYHVVEEAGYHIQSIVNE